MTRVVIHNYLTRDAFNEADHPRGQPKNKGQFVKGGGSTGGAAGKQSPSGKQRPRHSSKVTPEQLKKLQSHPAYTPAKLKAEKVLAKPEAKSAIQKGTDWLLEHTAGSSHQLFHRGVVMPALAAGITQAISYLGMDPGSMTGYLATGLSIYTINKIASNFGYSPKLVKDALVGIGKSILQAFDYDYKSFKPEFAATGGPFAHGHTRTTNDENEYIGGMGQESNEDYGPMLQALALFVWVLEHEYEDEDEDEV